MTKSETKVQNIGWRASLRKRQPVSHLYRLPNMVIPYKDGSKGEENVIFSRVPQEMPEDVPTTIKFLVENNGNSTTISGHKHKLLQMSPALAVFIASHQDQNTFRISNTDKRAFENFIRHLEGSQITLTSTKMARNTLDVACHFKCLSLLDICVTYILPNLTPANVLTVYGGLYRYCNSTQNFEPSAPSLDATSQEDDIRQIQNLCTDLRIKCLTLIDANIEVLAQRQEFECFDYKDMATVIQRSIHKIDNDKLYDYVLCWYKAECKRRKCVESKFSRKGPVADLLLKIKDEYEKDPKVQGITNADLITENTKDGPAQKVAKNKSKFKDEGEPSNALLNCLLVWTVLFD